MTTAARLVGAICLAALAYLGSGYLMTSIDERAIDFGYFRWLNVGLGLVIGWILLGGPTSRGYAHGVSSGVTATAVLVACGLVVQSAYEVLRLSMRHRYDGAMEAFGAIFEMALDFARYLADGGFILLMLCGAVVAGILTELAARNWR